MIKTKSILFIISIALNAFVVLSFIFAVANPVRVSAFSFLNMEKKAEGIQYKAAAVIANVPLENAEVSFSPAEITLRRGQSAALQFSVIADGSQLNIAGEALYDRSILRVEQSGFGIIIYALSEGESAIQTFGVEGFHDLARVIVK